MVPIKYKGFTSEVSSTCDGYTGTFQLDGSTCVFIAPTLEQIMPKFVQAVEEGLAYIRRTSDSDSLQDFVRKHNKGTQRALLIEYKPYHENEYFAYIPRKHVLFVQGFLSDGVPFLSKNEVDQLCDKYPFQTKNTYLGETKLFQVIPWESVIEVMNK
jgi:hypothetical protein